VWKVLGVVVMGLQLRSRRSIVKSRQISVADPNFPLARLHLASHICVMAETKPKIRFQVVRAKDGTWFVRLTLPHGLQPQINGFRREAEAQAWIKHESADWLNSYEGGRYA
jgi:hypothetical protein